MDLNINQIKLFPIEVRIKIYEYYIDTYQANLRKTIPFPIKPIELILGKFNLRPSFPRRILILQRYHNVLQ